MTLFCISACAVGIAGAQEQAGPATAGSTQVATATTAQADQTTQIQTNSMQPSGNPRSWWEPGAGFDMDSHSTGYGWIGPTYQHYISDNVRFVAKANVNYLFYEYESAIGHTRVSGPGVATQFGLKFGDTNWFRAGAGPAFKRRNTSFKFGDGSEADGAGEWRTGVNVGADAYLVPTNRTNIMAQAQYGTEDDFFWSRLMGRRQISNYGYTGRIANFVGAEVIGMGNPDFGSMQVGGLFEIMHVPSSASVQLRAGWKRQTFDFGDDQSGPYFGIGYWQRLR